MFYNSRMPHILRLWTIYDTVNKVLQALFIPAMLVGRHVEYLNRAKYYTFGLDYRGDNFTWSVTEAGRTHAQPHFRSYRMQIFH